jgi:hypothetical protein
MLRLVGGRQTKRQRGPTLQKIKILVMAAVISIPVLGLAAAPARACAGHPACDTINRICDKVVGPCIP